MRCHLQISSYRIDLTSVNGPISPKQCNYEMGYSFYSFNWLDSLKIWLDHNSTFYRSLSKNSNVKRRISYCDPKTPNIRHTLSFDLLRVEFSKQVSIIRRTLLFSEPEEHKESMYYIPKRKWSLIFPELHLSKKFPHNKMSFQQHFAHVLYISCKQYLECIFCFVIN